MKEICDALRNLVPFVQFKNREKHPWRKVTGESEEIEVSLFKFG